MSEVSQNSYPGSTASTREVLELAGAYNNAAVVLFINAEKLGGLTYAPLHYAPARMCAIHAIELFLNAFLRHEGISHGQIRGRMHNLADPSFVTTLKLRKKTAQHLQDMSEKREYLISRYGPEMVSQHTEVNRLMATSEEIMQKVCKHLNSTQAP